MSPVLALEDAYAQVGESGVAVARPDRGLVRLTGPQRVWFLQNTITNDVESVASGRWVESCFLDLKGKVVAHFRVGVTDDEIWLDVDPPGTADLTGWFTANRFRTKVEIEDRSASCVAIVGPPAAELAADGEIVVRDGVVIFGGGLVTDVHGSLETGLPLAPPELLEVLRMEAGIPRFGVDYGPATLPQEAGLTSIVSVEKGCYIGQEVMARLHFRGHVNRTVRPLRFDLVPPAPAPAPGTELRSGAERVGSVTSTAVSPRLGPLGIGMVRVTVADGQRVEAGGSTVVVGALPAGTKPAGPPRTAVPGAPA